MRKDFIIEEHVCAIILTMDAKKSTKKGTHAYTHDDYEREVSLHSCKGLINSNVVSEELFEVWGPEEIRAVVKKVEDVVVKRASSMRQEYEHMKKIQIVLKELGFNK